MSDFTIRPATEHDADAIASLLTELGHATDAADVPARLALVRADGGDALLAVDAHGVALAFMSLARFAVVQAPGPIGFISSFVVTRAAHRRGIGRALVVEGRAWAERNGCSRLNVTTGNHRSDAHAFYAACGFEFNGRRYAMVLR